MTSSLIVHIGKTGVAHCRRWSAKAGLALVGVCAAWAAQAQPYQVGVGMADITGAAAESGFGTYGATTHQSMGLLQRLRARAFVVHDNQTRKASAMVVVDTGLLTQAIHQAVLAKLATRYGGLYHKDNVMLTATHTHSGSSGMSHYALYNIPVLGFQKDNFNVTVNGIVEAIHKAHSSRADGEVLCNQGELKGASRNRSVAAFNRNPASERAVFPDNIDPLMTTLTFRRGGKAVGALNFFPTHGTSITHHNTLINGDNKGYAAYHWEHEVVGSRYRRDAEPFVAALAQTAAGDMSPNLNLRPGSGPTENQYENARLIGLSQATVGLKLSSQSTARLSGPLDYRMRYVDMSQLSVSGQYAPDGKPGTTCTAAVGAAAAAGSKEDGGGSDFFREGHSNAFAAAVGGLLFPPVSASLRECHGKKEILSATGLIKPHPWTPHILPVQLLRLGQLYLAAVPGEVTIMAGYRMRRQVAQTVGVPVNQVLVVGYSNAYADYITTPEEYSLQEYEGGFTIFGPYTAAAFQQELDRLAQDMAQGRPTYSDLQPPDLSCCQMNFQTGVVMDLPSFGRSFGSVLTDAKASYARGQTVTVRFQTGHPKNNFRIGGSFMEVQRLDGSNWTSLADDGDWATNYRWRRVWGAESVADISWTIPANAPSGKYRIVHYGDSKTIWGQITPFSGMSRVFQIN